MTTTGAEIGIHDVYTPEQVARLAALQGVSEFVYVLSGTVSSGVLIDLAEYVIGDDEPFDPVAEAHKAMAAIRYERGENYNGYDPVYVDGHDGCEYDDDAGAWSGPGAHEDGPLADWERELLDGPEQIATVEREILDFGFEPDSRLGNGYEDITVSDLAGFLTLPWTAILEDVDGDTWHYDHSGPGWTFGGACVHYSPADLFGIYGDSRNGEFNFIVTNPEVLS
jgi:hypothetical protein